MLKFKTSYSIKWEEWFAWLRKAKKPDNASMFEIKAGDRHLPVKCTKCLDIW